MSRLRGRRPPPTSLQPRWFRAIVAYDGGPWAGWQRQRDVASVGEVVLAALETATGTRVSLHAAGRTDAGVHAEGQAISIATPTALPASALLHICQMILPESVRFERVEEAPAGWNPQLECIGKLYRYRLLESARPAPAAERYAWRLERPLDLAALEAAAVLLRGTHDFRAFRNDPGPARRDQSTVRRVDGIDVERALGTVQVDVRGPGFLYMMVRNIVAVLVEVGAGRCDPEWAGKLLASRDRRLGPAPAPPHGLCLVRAYYADGFGDGAA